MKRLLWVAAGMAVAVTLTTQWGRGVALAGMLTGEVTKISGEMVDVKDDKGMVQTIHNDPIGTKRTGELKVGAMVEADVTSSGHANAITVKMPEMKKEMKKDMKKAMKKDGKKEMKK